MPKTGTNSAGLRAGILERAEKLGVKFLRLQFTDILGVIKNVEVPDRQFGEALDGRIMFDGSSIEGFVRIEESDMYLRPDLSTFQVFPWTDASGARVGRLICDIANPDGTPFAGCPRTVLKRVIAMAADRGFTMKAGPETEFFLFLRRDGRPTTETHDSASYFDLAPVDLGEDVRREIVLALEQMGMLVEAAHHEVAPGQHEVDFHYDDVLATADNVSTCRFIVKNVALRNNLHATFMPKPIFGVNGSGMHTHQSLFRDGQNAFFDADAEWQLSTTCLRYIGGLLRHAKGFCAITNPLVNSFKRLVPGYEAPVYLSWGRTNRSALVRVPLYKPSKGQSSRVEYRALDSAANPYLSYALLLAAGLKGIENEYELPPEAEDNVWSLTDAERRALGYAPLPASLDHALEYMEESELVAETLGEQVFNYVLLNKRREWQEYRSQVTPFELTTNLEML